MNKERKYYFNRLHITICSHILFCYILTAYRCKNQIFKFIYPTIYLYIYITIRISWRITLSKWLSNLRAVGEHISQTLVLDPPSCFISESRNFTVSLEAYISMPHPRDCFIWKHWIQQAVVEFAGSSPVAVSCRENYLFTLPEWETKPSAAGGGKPPVHQTFIWRRYQVMPWLSRVTRLRSYKTGFSDIRVAFRWLDLPCSLKQGPLLVSPWTSS